MKILYSLFIGILLLSCNSSNIIPTSYDDSCKVPIGHLNSHFTSLYGIENSFNNGDYIFVYSLNSSDKGFEIYLYNVLTKNLERLDIHSLLDGYITSPFCSIHICPYDDNIALFEITYIKYQDSMLSQTKVSYFRLNKKDKSFVDVTPSNEIDIKVNNLGMLKKQWLSTSSPNNDLFDIQDFGVYKFQDWSQIQPVDKSFYQYAVSSSGKYRLMKMKSDTVLYINSIKITDINNQKSRGVFSPNEKYLVFNEYGFFDTLYPNQQFWKMYIYDVEETLASGKAVLHTTIDYKNQLCALQVGNFNITPQNTILISMNRFTYKEKSDLYEIDFNGKILRQLTNE